VKSTYVVTKAEMVRRGDLTVADALAQVPASTRAQRTARYDLGDYHRRLPHDPDIGADRRPPGGAEAIEFTSGMLGSMPTAGVQRIEVVEAAARRSTAPARSVA